MKHIINETNEILDYIFEKDEGDDNSDEILAKLNDLDPEVVADMDHEDEIGLDDDSDVDDNNDNIHPDDVHMMADDDIEDEKDIEEALTIDEASPIKSAKEILKDRYKRKARLFILSDEGKNKTITPLMIAKFNEKYEWDPKVGRFGRWRIRRDKMAYKKANPTQKAIKKIKKKKKILKRIKKRGNVQAKSARTAKKKAIRLGGKDVSATGKITKTV